jgi:hypothetical protein
MGKKTLWEFMCMSVAFLVCSYALSMLWIYKNNVMADTYLILSILIWEAK